MNGWEHAGWMISASLIVNIVIYLLGRKHGSNNCSTCGIAALKTQIEEAVRELARMCNLVRALAEKAGMTVKEQLEIEKISGGE
jgi:hypothetical protein